MNRKKAPKQRRQDMSEEDIALEIAGDKRLRELGIDPDADDMDVLRELDRLREEEAERRAKEQQQP